MAVSVRIAGRLYVDIQASALKGILGRYRGMDKHPTCELSRILRQVDTWLLIYARFIQQSANCANDVFCLIQIVNNQS